MKIKKILMYISIILGLIFVVLLGWIIKNNGSNKKNNEIVPEQEISDNQLRQTIVTLYFLDKQTLKLEPEARNIDVKKLINNPYQYLINILIEGPKNNELIKLIPNGTKLNNIEIIGDIVYIDFSEEFIKEQALGKEQELLIINSILKTLLELNEVSGIKILINGEEGKAFPDNCINFREIFELKQ